MKRYYIIAICILLSLIVLTSCSTPTQPTESKESTSMATQPTENETSVDTINYLPFDIDNTGTINRFYANEKNSVNIVIPSTYSFDENGKIISGTAYEIKAIGYGCFSNNTLIESIVIPETITTIGAKAFYNCTKLKNINISNNISLIGEDAFEMCPQLTVIAKNGTAGLILDVNVKLAAFSIPSSITKIDDDAFSNWEKLSSIVIPNNVKSIGHNAFSHCKNLARVCIESSLDSWGENAFSGCEKLTELATSDTIKGIYFAHPQEITDFTVPLSITTIRNEFFYGWKQLEKVTIHKSISTLGMIFKDNDNLTNLTCGSNNVLSLFFHQPDYEDKIESETMYVIVHRPGNYSYTYNYYVPSTLKEIHLLNDVDSYCLYGMKSVQSVYIPSTVSEFGTSAFAECSGLENVYFSTNHDWKYLMSYYSTDSGIISMEIMNNPTQLAAELKAHNGYYYRWYQLSA